MNRIAILFLLFVTASIVCTSRNNDKKPHASASKPRNVVALTFDDGPSSRYTPQILDLLKQKGVRATFFLIGQNAVTYPDLVKREVREGHAIGNHTWSHPVFGPLETNHQFAKEITMADSAIFSITGIHTTLFRPPHGWCSPWMEKNIEKMGYDVIDWTVDPKDWKHPHANIIVRRVEHSFGKSAIVLLHDGLEMRKDPQQENTVQALGQIIDDFKAQGYEFVTIQQLINDPENSKEYRALFKCINGPDCSRIKCIKPGQSVVAGRMPAAKVSSN